MGAVRFGPTRPPQTGGGPACYTRNSRGGVGLSLALLLNLHMARVLSSKGNEGVEREWKERSREIRSNSATADSSRDRVLRKGGRCVNSASLPAYHRVLNTEKGERE